MSNRFDLLVRCTLTKYQSYLKTVSLIQSNLCRVFLCFAEAFTATWSKFYCTYKKQQKLFSMLPYNQISGRTEQPPETLTLTTCTRRASDFEKRFCFDLTFEQKPGITFTFQALSEEDRKAWLNAMDGKEPVSRQFHSFFRVCFSEVFELVPN